MPCYHPLFVIKPYDGGKLIFNNRDADGVPLKIPCGQCIGCRIDRARQWALRCVHESMYHDHNSFLTLTYSPETLRYTEETFLPTLVLRDCQLFLKRLRKRLGKFRYFLAGEYGSEFSRPHYHLLLFGLDFPDKVYLSRNKYRDVYYISPTLSDLWPYGFHTIGSLTPRTAQYCAQYCLKKVIGKDSWTQYLCRKPEFITVSRAPGLGNAFYHDHFEQMYIDDYVVDSNGKKMSIPAYYDNLHFTLHPHLKEEYSIERQIRAMSYKDELTEPRLCAKEICAQARVKDRMTKEFSDVTDVCDL